MTILFINMDKPLIILAAFVLICQQTNSQNKTREKGIRLGVTHINKKNTDNGYRLYSSRNHTTAHLITPEGKYVHTWYYPHEEYVVTSDFGGFGRSWHYAGMLPNGNLITISDNG